MYVIVRMVQSGTKQKQIVRNLTKRYEWWDVVRNGTNNAKWYEKLGNGTQLYEIGSMMQKLTKS